jgi:hypothetical protein
MKTLNAIRQILPVVFFALTLMAASVEVTAQNKGNYKKSDKNSDRKEYRNTDRSVQKYDKKSGNDSRYGDGKDYARYHSGKKNGTYVYSDHNSKKKNYSHKNYINHPKYGKVYQRFDHNPVVFRHSRGNYYYSGNNFYSYRRGVGYYVVEPPRQVYFRELPFRSERVYAHGQPYYRNGDLYFSYTPRGYVIVPSPFKVNFSVRF